MSDDIRRAKEHAARWAVDQVDDGMVVGLGTGSTAGAAIAALGRSVDAGLDVTGVPTSFAARARAIEAGIPVTQPDAVDRIDIAIDGADQVADGVLIKGGGGAHTTERLVDARADQFLVVVDHSKEVETLDRAVPLEVVPQATRWVGETIDALGGTADVRQATAIDGPAFTERGNVVMDASFGTISDPATLATDLDRTAGIVDHGLFIDEADVIAIGSPDGVRTLSV